MASIETRVTIVSNPSEPLTIRFEVINNGNNNVRILKRYTPLEGLKCDCLAVKLDGSKVPYDGFHFKRAEENLSISIPLAAGETISNTVNVSEAYDTTRPGNYEVSFPKNRLVILPESNMELMSYTITKIKSITTIATIGASQQKATASFALTAGAQSRMQFTSLALPLAPLPPIFLNATTEQEKIILRAHNNGLKYAEKSAKNIAKDARYNEWFGEYNDTRPERVIKAYEKIANRRARFQYRVDGKYCDEDTYAYTTIGGSEIWLCTKFWTAPDEGIESRAGTIVHEHSHASAGTDDHDYMRMACRDLAREHPLKAVRNADSYEFFSEFLMQE